MEKKVHNKLGRGLETLLGGVEIPVSSDSVVNINHDAGSLIRIDSIEANPEQPRTFFDDVALNELAASIKTYGLIQPITVRPIKGGKYQIISGERRFRASQIAGLVEIPAYVRTVDEVEALQMSLVENIQRENLNPLEVSFSYQRLLNECNLSPEELSVKVGKDRSTIVNYLRILKLSKEAQIAVRDKQISMGHARSIVSIEDIQLQNRILKEILNKHLSVRQTETLVKNALLENKKTKTKVKINLSDQVINFQKNLSQKVSAKVVVKKDIKGKGKICIDFNSDEELNKIIGSFESLL